MYEIKKNSRTLEDGTKITTYSREIDNHPHFNLFNLE